MKTISLASLNWADYTIIGLIVISALISLVRGFVREALSLVTWVVALWVAYKFASGLADYFVNYVKLPTLRFALAFIIIFILILIAGALINFAISSLVSKTGLTGTDRLIGLIFGVARGLLLIGILVLLGNMTIVSKDPWWSQSQFIPHFQGMATWLRGLLPEQINHWNKMIHDQGMGSENTATATSANIPSDASNNSNVTTSQPGDNNSLTE